MSTRVEWTSDVTINDVLVLLTGLGYQEATRNEGHGLDAPNVFAVLCPGLYAPEELWVCQPDRTQVTFVPGGVLDAA